MKRYVLILIFFITSIGAQYHDTGINVEAIFLPQAQKLVYTKLESILSGARKRVLLAMYWLTYKPVVDKLIELKRKNIDVQIILDQSSIADTREGAEVVDALRAAGIHPTISPSKSVQGIMHNKFMVIDSAKVWTGSANFTKSVLDPSDAFLNDENIVIMYSPKLAGSYTEQFNKLKQDIAGMERGEFRQPPPVSPQRPPKRKPSGEVHREKPKFTSRDFQSAVYRGSLSAQEAEPTDSQRSEILRLGGFIHPNLTRTQASEVIAKLRARRASGRSQQIQAPVYEDSPDEDDRPTNAQIREIRRLGGYIHPNLTRQKADAAIKTLKRRRK